MGLFFFSEIGPLQQQQTLKKTKRLLRNSFVSLPSVLSFSRRICRDLYSSSIPSFWVTTTDIASFKHELTYRNTTEICLQLSCVSRIIALLEENESVGWNAKKKPLKSVKILDLDWFFFSFAEICDYAFCFPSFLFFCNWKLDTTAVTAPPESHSMHRITCLNIFMVTNGSWIL